MEWTWLYIVIIFLLVTVIAYLIYLMVNRQAKMIDPAKCGQVKADFAVLPQMSGKILRNCLTSDGICQFQVANLKEALEKCQRQSQLCQVFNFMPQGEAYLMTFVDPKGEIVKDGSRDIYLFERQNPLKFMS